MNNGRPLAATVPPSLKRGSKGKTKSKTKSKTKLETKSKSIVSKTKKKTRLSKLAQCIRKTANTVKLPRTLMPDSPQFDKSAVLPGLSSKLTLLVQKIKELDAADLKEHNTLFKHFIFTDIRESAFGAKAVTSFLLAAGFDLRMKHIEKQIKRGGELVLTKAGTTVYDPKESTPKGGNGFAVLQSLPMWHNSLTVETKKAVIAAYNKRPENVNGEQLRIIVLDSKFKEGIDLFDVKHVHLLEPAIATSDLKQAVGRATRYCGQKGLPFQARSGWRLNVYIYNTELPLREPFTKEEAHKLMLEHSGLDLALLNMTQEITILAIQSAVDYDLNYKINNFSIDQAILEETEGLEEDAFPKPKTINSMSKYEKYRWPKPLVKDGCTVVQEKGKAVVFSKTQDFIRHYLRPEAPIKGLLAWHSVGTGKTCMAVAAATTEFEQAGYTILWVTRNSLMADVYKNIFGSVCSIPLMKDGQKFPEELSKQKRLLSKAWMPPISYRTFQNALEQKNELGRTLYKRNPLDPLKKTFLVIDEIHKLQDGDLSAAEAADFHTIQSYIFKSYEASGKDSVRPLLMTATPITDSPKELFEILNTLIPASDDRLPSLDEFRDKFVTEDGAISEQGKTFYKKRAKGLVSYLNREFDPTTFAQPKFTTVAVRLSDPSTADIPAFIDKYMSEIGIDNLLAEQMQEKDCDAGLNKALKSTDDQITEIEEEILQTDDKEELQLLKSRIADLKQTIKDIKWQHAKTKKKCMKTNKELAKAEIKTRKAKMAVLIKAMKQKYDKEVKKASSGQMKALEECFNFKRKAKKEDDEFTKIANERFFPTKQKTV